MRCASSEISVMRKNRAMSVVNRTIFLLLVSILSCGKNGKSGSKADSDNAVEIFQPGSQVFAAAADGVYLREDADISGRKLALIPFGDKLEVHGSSTVYTVIDGRRGAWVKVKWQNLPGFVFGGFLAKDLNTALIGRIFSYGLQCTGLSHSEFTWRLYFLPESRYRMEHISAFATDCSLVHIAEGSYMLKNNLLRLKSKNSQNVFKGGGACPKTVPPELTTGYGYIDSGNYTMTRCDGRLAFTRGQNSSDQFVLISKSP